MTIKLIRWLKIGLKSNYTKASERQLRSWKVSQGKIVIAQIGMINMKVNTRTSSNKQD
jgi:hypothetical protein